MTWTLPLTIADEYDVYARWITGTASATDVKYTITHAGGSDTVTVNQQLNAGTWFKLGTYDLLPGAGHKVTVSDAVRVISKQPTRAGGALGIEPKPLPGILRTRLGIPPAVTP